nr:cardioacceleratory peptide receptor-like [Penaeus vannamei]
MDQNLQKSESKRHWACVQVYLLLVLVLVFISCEVLLPVFYLRIYFTLWRQNSYFKGGQRGHSDSRRTNSLLPKAKTKTLKMTFVIVVTFFVTNTPYVIQELVLAFGKNLDPSVIAIFGIISASNSALNPFIYLLFCPKNESRSSESYRVTFKSRFTLNGRADSQHTPASAQDSLISTSKTGR